MSAHGPGEKESPSRGARRVLFIHGAGGEAFREDEALVLIATPLLEDGGLGGSRVPVARRLAEFFDG